MVRELIEPKTYAKDDSTLLIAVEVMLNNNMKPLRQEQVMTSEDTAKLYEVTPEYLGQRVNKNKARVPADFMLRLTKQERSILRTRRSYAFTEKGIFMAGGLLKSERAIKVHTQIINYFVKLYKERYNSIIIENQEVAVLFEALKQMIKE